MSIWYTADLHLGHARIIDYCGRPFADITEMDQVLIDCWNVVVRPGDDVYVVGDFAYGSPEMVGHYLRRLRGKKHLIWGNHDRKSARSIRRWASSQALADISVDGQRVFMSHYAMRTWPGIHHGAVHLYGHSHGLLAPWRGSLDVGVDSWGYSPVSLEQIQERLQEAVPCSPPVQDSSP